MSVRVQELESAAKNAILRHNDVLDKAHKVYLNTNYADKHVVYRSAILAANESYTNYTTAIKVAKAADKALNEAVEAYMNDKLSESLCVDFINAHGVNTIAWQRYEAAKIEHDK